MMTPEEKAEIENLVHRHNILLEQHRELQREAEDLRRRCARMMEEREIWRTAHIQPPRVTL